MRISEKVEEFSDQIGERLRKAREAAGLAVEDVTFKTRIPRSVVEALEAGDFSVFSTPIYAKSFLSQYSDYLEVDARLWLDALEPAAFIPGGEIMRPHWQGGESDRPSPRDDAGQASAARASMLMFVFVTGALIFAAVAGFEHFEKRFGGEPPPKVEAPPETPAVPEPARAPRAEPPPKAIAQPEPEEVDPPPPRAIPVE